VIHTVLAQRTFDDRSLQVYLTLSFAYACATSTPTQVRPCL
jgi:hypothetical protein